jgi:hypothetical protein
MITTTQKLQILESLSYLDQAQSDKVLSFINSLLKSPKEDVKYKRWKSEAMKEIRKALQTRTL